VAQCIIVWTIVHVLSAARKNVPIYPELSPPGLICRYPSVMQEDSGASANSRFPSTTFP